MTLSAWQDERRLVPRWRALADTIRSGELAWPLVGRDRRVDALSPELVITLERWQLEPDLHTSADLLEQALVEGREDKAINAAKSLLSRDSTAAPLIMQQAADVLRRAGREEDIPPRFMIESLPEIIAKRHPTRINPRDPLGWVELALHQTVNGHLDAAERSMIVARGLAPDNRHVLRSAARLLLHKEKREEAHDLLARSAATRTDPWLQAAEIAMADLAGRDPRCMKLGRRNLDVGLAPKQVTELAGAIGTVELLDGNRRKARKRFALSMVDPTGNALAQGEWAAARLGDEVVPAELLERVSERWEAQALHTYRQFRFDQVPDLCTKWAEIDLYSTKPFLLASGAASQADDNTRALALAELGLGRKPDSFLLLNSKAFAAASMDQLEVASAALVRARHQRYDAPGAFLINANMGLLAFRAGLHDRGISLYTSAIDGFRRLGLEGMSASARVYLAREAVLANLDNARELVISAKKELQKHTRNENLFVLRKVERAIGIEQTPLPPDLREIPDGRPIEISEPRPDKIDFSKLRFTFERSPKLIS